MAHIKRKRSIVTKSGDAGSTRLFSGERRAKNDRQIVFCGDIDEAASILGVARCHARNVSTRKALRYIQRCLFIVGAEMATSPHRVRKLRRRVDARMVRGLEKRLFALEARVTMPRAFIIPGASIGSSYIDHARAVIRRGERTAVSLLKRKKIDNQLIVAWLNRLSDYLYIVARSEDAPGE